MKVLVAGASTFSVDNLGDDAMLAALVQAIEFASPNSDVKLLARHPRSEYDSYFRVSTVQNLEHQSASEASGRMFRGFNKGDAREPLASVFRAIQQADVLILAGNLLMEVSENTHLRGVSSYAALLTTLAQVAGTPTAIFGLNVVSPIQSSTSRAHARHVLGAAAVATVREPAALQHLRDAEVECSALVVGGDPAVGLVPESRSDVLTSRRAPDGQRLVSICMRSEYWLASETRSLSDEAQAAFENLLSTGAHVRLVPNCTYINGHPMQDDRAYHRAVFGEYAGAVEFVEDQLGLYETIRLLSESDIHLTNRRHSAILAMHAGALPLPINVSLETHMSGFLADLSLGHVFFGGLQEALTMAANMTDAELRQERAASQASIAKASALVRNKSIAFVEELSGCVMATHA